VKYREGYEPVNEVTRTQTKQGLSGEVGLGERLRQARVSLGMTQSELASHRFSKEYVSQIERGKTRPTQETIHWLAERLGVDPGFLADGVSTDQRDRVETGLARAEALSEAGEQEESLKAYGSLRRQVAGTGIPELALRAASGEAKARIRAGQVREALELLLGARELSERPSITSVDRANVLFLLGVCRYLLSSVSTAVGLLSEALDLASASNLPCDKLRSEILHWRSRCYRRQRDYEAAREDVEHALELAQALEDRRTVGQLYFQASLLAEREGHWILARTYAERAKAQYEEVADRSNLGKILNNIGGLNFLLGRPADAVRYLKEAFATALEVGSDADAAEAVSSLARVHLSQGDSASAETHARHAIELFHKREDLLDGIGSAYVVLGRALLEQDRLEEADIAFAESESCFARLSSASHCATAWVAQGDLATRRGDDRTAARLYRRAAEALQDFRF
jgi:tetratricopeptide (TPR) repeat protein/DNA-binding XRE family transcriptional regulator